MMAINLFKLSHYYSNSYYFKVSQQMLHNVKDKTFKYGSGYSNWLLLMSNFVGEFYEIVISGKNAFEKLSKIHKKYIPNKILAGSIKDSNLPLLKGRYTDQETYIFVCENGACKLPEINAQKAITKLKIEF